MTRSFEDSLIEAARNKAGAAGRLHGNQPAPSPGNPPDKAAVYARFIPREELRSFAAWMPRALSGGEQEPINSGVQRPMPAKPKETEKPKQTEQDMAAMLRASRQAGYQDGYRDGLVALEAFKQSFMNQMMGQLGSMTGSFQSQLDEIQLQMSQALVRTATQLARQVVRTELATRPDLIAGVAQEALGVLLTSARHITMRVHPDDMAMVAHGAGETLAARGARLLPDASVTRGGCMVDSDLGVVEANVETRWRRAAEQIGNREAYDEPMTPAQLADAAGVAGVAGAADVIAPVSLAPEADRSPPASFTEDRA